MPHFSEEQKDNTLYELAQAQGKAKSYTSQSEQALEQGDYQASEILSRLALTQATLATSLAAQARLQYNN